MKVESPGGGTYVITDGVERLELSQTNYEDIFYAIPIDNGSLYLLINDTVLEDNDKRSVLKRMVDKIGGIESAMTAIQTAVKEVEPSQDTATPAEAVEENLFQVSEESDFVTVVIKGSPPEEAEPEIALVDTGGGDLSLASDTDLAGMDTINLTAADLEVPVKPPAPAAKAKPAPKPVEEEEIVIFGGEDEEPAPTKPKAPGKPEPARPPAKPFPAAKGKPTPMPQEEDAGELASLESDDDMPVLEEEPAPVTPKAPGRPAAKAPAGPVKPEPKAPVKPVAKEPVKPVAKAPSVPIKGKPAPKPGGASFDDADFDNLPDLADDEVVTLDDDRPAKAPAAKGAIGKPAVPAKPEPAKPAAKAPAGPTKPEPKAPAGPAKPEPKAPAGPAKPAAAAPDKGGKPGYPEKKEPAAATAGKPGAPSAAAGKVKPKMGHDGKPILTLTKLGANEFALGFGELVCTLDKGRYEKLYETCPIDTSSLFRLLMAEILDGAAKVVFRKIIASAGHSKPILDALNEQVQELDPG